MWGEKKDQSLDLLVEHKGFGQKASKMEQDLRITSHSEQADPIQVIQLIKALYCYSLPHILQISKSIFIPCK